MRERTITSAFSSSSLLKIVTVSPLLVASVATSAPIADLGGDDTRVLVTEVSGDVAVTMAGQRAEVESQSTLVLPTRIVTGEDGLLGFAQASTSVTVASDSDVEIPAEAVDGNLIARLVQHRGNVFYDVAKREVGKLRVETPLLVAVIKGTQFNVAVVADSTTISLFEGQLEIRTPDGSEVVSLEAGEIAIRSRNDDAIRIVGMDDRRVAAPDAGRAVAPASDVLGRRAAAELAVDATGSLGASVDVLGRPALDGADARQPAVIELAKTATIEADIDLGGADAGTTLDARIDLGAPSVDASAAVEIELGSGSAEATLDTRVDLAAVSLAASAEAEFDLSSAGVEAGAAGAALGADIDTSLDVALDTQSGVAAGSTIELGPLELDLDAGLDLDSGALDLDLDLDGDEESTETSSPAPEPSPTPRGGLGGLL